MAEYTPNSHKYKAEQAAKEEREKQEKIVSGTAKRKKKSELSRIGNALISEDAGNVKNHVIMDVLVPALKNALSDVVTDAVNMILFGDSRRGERGRSRSNYVSYDTRYRGGSEYSSSRSFNYRRDGYDFDDVILDTRGDAADVLDRMNEIVETYGLVRVADLYDLVGLTCNYTDNKYGWTSLRTADIVRVRDGYTLKLPKAMPID